MWKYLRDLLIADNMRLIRKLKVQRGLVSSANKRIAELEGDVGDLGRRLYGLNVAGLGHEETERELGAASRLSKTIDGLRRKIAKLEESRDGLYTELRKEQKKNEKSDGHYIRMTNLAHEICDEKEALEKELKLSRDIVDAQRTELQHYKSKVVYNDAYEVLREKFHASQRGQAVLRERLGRANRYIMYHQVGSPSNARLFNECEDLRVALKKAGYEIRNLMRRKGSDIPQPPSDKLP